MSRALRYFLGMINMDTYTMIMYTDIMHTSFLLWLPAEYIYEPQWWVHVRVLVVCREVLYIQSYSNQKVETKAMMFYKKLGLTITSCDCIFRPQ